MTERARPTEIRAVVTGGGIIMLGLSCALVPLFAGCTTRGAPTTPSSEERTEEVQPCRGYEDAERLSGQRVAVEGTYEQVDVRKRRPDAETEPVYAGHAVIRLESGDRIFLEPIWSDDAIRPPEEIDRHEGERARAVGVIRYPCPSSPEAAATIITPCLRPVERVVEAGPRRSP